MNKSTYHISQMDCPSEENLIRMKLADVKSISSMDFHLADRTLYVFHEGDNEEITKVLLSLNLGAALREEKKETAFVNIQDPSKQRKVLWVVLAINFGFFLIEMTTGILSKSMGLVADSLDMLADALVYGMSLMAVGATVAKKKKVALFSGLLQILLAVLGFSEVIRRFMGLEIMPEFRTMIIISLLALVANTTCLWLLQRTKSKDAHIRASVIFSANDVIINIGVIIAALFVWWFNSNIPDLIIGIIVFLVVIRGAVRILKLTK
ncbi:MAG: cation diffusion facilitator family transporter [Tannerella sp.]|jgi:Co/Zn/Cd efflux system component|nr:cation diffusion facilitator family transporter [Tannerella sp.]